MTERLYYTDSYLREFRARVIEASADGRRVYLDRTAFYPTSGGQPFDTGTLGSAAVLDVVDEETRVAHLLETPVAVGDVSCAIDWTRRYDHMQQHTGQHLLSAVLQELFDMPTVSFHLGADACTIDVRGPSISASQIERAEHRCAQIVGEARSVIVTFEDAAQGLRKASERTGTLRILSIEGIDRSACGGTHVRSTAEIGAVLLRRIEKVRDTMRLEFVCGNRALRRARQDYRSLASIGHSLSSPFEETPDLVAALIAKNKTLQKTGNQLAIELARREGRELYQSTLPSAGGIRYRTERGPIDDATRTRAQAFVAGEKAVFLAVCENPPSILLAASPDSGIDAGARVKAAVADAGGRGGGSKTLAQGSVPTLDKLDASVAALAVVF